MSTKDDRVMLRTDIVKFCIEPKTFDEINHHFRLGSMKLASHLSWLRMEGFLVIKDPGQKYVWNKKMDLSGIR